MDIKNWDKIKAGDKLSFQMLFDEYYSSLCLFANSMINDIDLAQDIVSDCFVRIWERKEQIQIKTSIEKYLLLAVRNNIYSYLRSPQSRKTNIDEVIERLEKIPIEEYDLEKDETIQQVYRLIEELPEQRKKILKLATFKGMTYREIADKLNISVNTVKTQISRVYSFLRDKMNNINIF